MDLKMNLGDAAIDAVMGYAIVFLGIALLVLVVVLVGKEEAIAQMVRNNHIAQRFTTLHQRLIEEMG